MRRPRGQHPLAGVPPMPIPVYRTRDGIGDAPRGLVERLVPDPEHRHAPLAFQTEP
jgi:hypothetical protein